MPDVKIDGFKCIRCEHVWVPRDHTQRPLICPKCKSPYWDRPPTKRVVEKVPITVEGYRCERCAHEWAPRSEAVPRVCPKCKSPYWDRSRRGG